MSIHKTNTTNINAGRLGRRDFFRGLGLAGLGAALTRGFGAQPVWASPAPASPAPMAAGQPTTSILEVDEGRVLLRTGPIPTFPASEGARLGVCLLTSGVVGAGAPPPLIRGIAAARTDHGNLGPFLADPRVERGVYQLLGALDTVRPVELHGLSAEVTDDMEAGGSLEITWEATLRHEGMEELCEYLDRYHACVFGELSPKSTFKGHLSYVEVSRRS